MTIAKELQGTEYTFVQDLAQPALLFSQDGEILDNNQALADLLRESSVVISSQTYQELAAYHHVLPPCAELNQKKEWKRFAVIWHQHKYDGHILLLGKLRYGQDVSHANAVSGALSQITGQLPQANMNLADCLTAAQDYYENILAAMPGNVYWMDRNGTYLGCNQNLANMANLDSPKDIFGKKHEDFLQGEVADQIVKTDREVMETGQTLSLEEHGWAVDGKPAIYITTKVPLRDRRGRVIGLLGTSFDISDRKKAEKQLKHAKELAEMANESKSEFIANMSHDIRTPFSGIYSLIVFLRDQEEDSEKQLLLGEVAQSARSLLDFLNQILELTELDADTIAPKKQLFDLRVEIDALVDLMRSQARSQGLDLFVECADDFPEKVVGDVVRVNRILLNLLSNAFKFTKQGSVTLSARLHSRQLQYGMLELKVADTGIGIPSDKQHIIFEQFTRLSPANKGIYSGAGLGLWIVKKILDDVGGTVTVESRENEGSVFTCLVPLEMI